MEYNMVKFKRQPLKQGYNRLRTAGLGSKKSATHQGVDLAVDNGYRCYAVDDGIVVNVSRGLDGYGWTITIKLHSGLYAFYAHLSDIRVKLNQKVKAGEIIALSGSTGNAKGMTTVSKGAHLHFEVRTAMLVGLGLIGRLNPLDYFDLDE